MIYVHKGETLREVFDRSIHFDEFGDGREGVLLVFLDDGSLKMLELVDVVG